MNPIVTLVLSFVLVGAWAAQGVRWLRVLQREHYDPSSMNRFLARWSSPQVGPARPVDRKEPRPITLSHLTMGALVVAILIHNVGVAVAATIIYGAFCPQGLGLKGRTSPLQWTRRLRTVAVAAGLVAALVVVVAAVGGRVLWGMVVVVWGVPLTLDLTTRLLRPWEKRQSQVFVDKAQRRLQQVDPTVVAITGSYGKTSTKNHLADLLQRDGGVVATPKSFNNRAGLSRAINEGLVDGTRVFIAEMGTYGPGEIADLCSWCPPDLSVITAIGPVHLERMGSLETIEQAKFEITQRAATVVVNVDDLLLRAWPARLTGKTVRTAGSKVDADVQVRVVGDEWVIVVDGATVATTAPLASVQPTNLACAIAAALLLGLSIDDLGSRLAAVSPVANRANVITAPSGVVVIDDTFNANPASADASVRLLASQPVSGRRVVITPGLIELGREQYRENAILATTVRDIGAELVVVNRTNVRALRDGYAGEIRRFNHRDDAVAWVRSSLGPGDAVLYLNDLPDHYI